MSGRQHEVVVMNVIQGLKMYCSDYDCLWHQFFMVYLSISSIDWRHSARLPGSARPEWRWMCWMLNLMVFQIECLIKHDTEWCFQMDRQQSVDIIIHSETSFYLNDRIEPRWCHRASMSSWYDSSNRRRLSEVSGRAGCRGRYHYCHSRFSLPLSFLSFAVQFSPSSHLSKHRTDDYDQWLTQNNRWHSVVLRRAGVIAHGLEPHHLCVRVCMHMHMYAICILKVSV